MAVKKIRLKSSIAGAGFSHRKGAVVDFPADEADYMISRGVAEEVVSDIVTKGVKAPAEAVGEAESELPAKPGKKAK